jgi:uncharacterized membrane protein
VNSAAWRKRLSIIRNWLYLYPEPESKPRTRWFWLAMGVVTVAVVVFCAYFITLMLARQNAYLTNAEDTGIMDQAIWNTLHGNILHQTICNIVSDTNCYSQNGIMRFAIHFEPILFLVSLFYLLWSTPKTLFVIQIIIVGLGAYPAFWLARLRLRNEWAAVAIALLYLLYPAQQQAVVYDFHAVTFTAALLMFTLYFMYTRKTALMFTFALLAMACKEEIPLVIMMFGLWSSIFQQRWKSGLGLAVLGVGWFVLVVSVVMPHFSPTGHPLLESRFAGLGKGPVQIASNILLHPIFIIKQYVLESQHRSYLKILFAPAAYLPLLAPWVLVLALPSLAINLFSSDPQMYSGLFQYNAEIVPILIFATIESVVLILWVVQLVIARIQQRKTQAQPSAGMPEPAQRQHRLRWSLVTTAVLAALLVATLFKAVQADYFFFGNLPFSQNFTWPETSAHTTLAQHFIAMIPPDASVSAQTKLVPHLSERKSIYMFPYGDDQADYILLDTTSDMYPFPRTIDYIEAAKSVILSGHYGIVAAQDGYILLKRGLPAPGVASTSAVRPGPDGNMLAVQPDLPTSFCSGSYTRLDPSIQQMQATFSGLGGSIDLVGYKVTAPTPLSQSKQFIGVTTYWRVAQPIRTPLQIELLIEGSNEEEYLASIDFPMQWWCQTNIWKPGMIVQVTSKNFGLENDGIPNGLAHMSIALVPLTPSSSKIMDISARLSPHVVHAPSGVVPTQTHALQMAQLQLVP